LISAAFISEIWKTKNCIINIYKQPTGEHFMSDIKARIVKVICEQLDVEASKVTNEADFLEDLGADSLDTVELVMAFEEEFDVEIPDDTAEKIKTVNDVLALVSDKVAA